MNRQKRIEQETNQTLSVLDELARVPANPWLYARIQAKMAAQQKTASPKFLPAAIQTALFCILLIGNGAALYATQRGIPAGNEQQLVDAVSKQYGLRPQTDGTLLPIPK